MRRIQGYSKTGNDIVGLRYGIQTQHRATNDAEPRGYFSSPNYLATGLTVCKIF
ncbi:hypothetical protein PAMC26577_39110 [Caballeronia sordidicola]|uniref:Uncharacterized protein n=1 Tax=Caballeronia sordidicola TaxID=196367 RepID=A0A242M396_CABSO|nr:hypothetical protein PAMC26577_39110 [Caballeronia sordidicola]